MKKNLFKKLFSTTLALVMCATLATPINKVVNAAETKAVPSPVSSTPIPDKVLVGYWHNFNNGTGEIKLRDVSPAWDVINLSFGEPTSVTSGDIQFSPFNATDDEFIEDVNYLKSQGKKVLLSIGGQNGQVQLTTTAARDKFVESVCGIIDKYGLDGLDIDFEGHSLYFNAGDGDFKNPTTPVIVNLISALKTITAKYGDNFVLTMAPETFFVQMGRTFYGGLNSNVDSRCGAYLPVIYAMRDELDWLQVQYYNSGTINDINGKGQNMGSAEFYAALGHMLLTGFDIMGDPNNHFPALRADQVVIGVPACTGAGNGWVSNAGVQSALDALMKGGTCGSYTIPEGFPELRGLMAWSVNWDAYKNFEFTQYFRNYFDTIAPAVSELKAATLSAGKVKNGSFTLTASIPKKNTATSYKIFENGTAIASGSLTADQTTAVTITKDITKSTVGVYEYTITLYDSSNSVTSNKVSVDTTPIPNTAPVINGVCSKQVSRGTNLNVLNGVTAVDKEDGDLTSSIKVTGTVDTAVAGSYDVYYSVTDSDGETTTARAVFIVVNNTSLGEDTFVLDKVYTGGETVIYNGVKYKCLWWTQGAYPNNSSAWEKIEGSDSITDIVDLATVANKYRTKKGDLGYDESLDLNSDGIIDIIDIVMVARTMN